MATATHETRDDILAVVLSDESFYPAAPRTLEETGLSVSLIETLVC